MVGFLDTLLFSNSDHVIQYAAKINRFIQRTYILISIFSPWIMLIFDIHDAAAVVISTLLIQILV